MAFNKVVDFVVVTTDGYKCTVGRVYVNGLDVKAKLVHDGYVWVNRRYAKDEALYQLEAEEKAKAVRWRFGVDEKSIPP